MSTIDNYKFCQICILPGVGEINDTDPSAPKIFIKNDREGGREGHRRKSGGVTFMIKGGGCYRMGTHQTKINST